MIYTQIFQRCIDFRRQNLTSTVDPRAEENKHLQWPYTHNIDKAERAD